MNTVLLYGSDRNTETTEILLRAVRRIHASALQVTAGSVALLPHGALSADYLIIDNASIRDIRLDKGIVLFREDVEGIDANSEFPKNFTAIVDPNNLDAIAAIQNRVSQVVTCGLSQKSTVTFSSLESNKAVISFQREIKALDGSAVFPCEIPVTFLNLPGGYPLLACIAVLVISGANIPEKGIEI